VECILKSLRNKGNVKIIDTPHYVEKSNRKHCDYEWGYELLKNSSPLMVKYSKDNKFKLIYKNPKNERYNIVFVIFIMNHENIKLITTHPERRRET